MTKITTETLPNATAQQVFDEAVTYFINNPFRCSTTNGSGDVVCLYRDEKGNTCVGGNYITEEKYSDEMENLCWNSLVENGYVPEDHNYLISSLQEIHDNDKYKNQEERLEKIANGLERLSTVNGFGFNRSLFMENATPIWSPTFTNE